MQTAEAPTSAVRVIPDMWGLGSFVPTRKPEFNNPAGEGRDSCSLISAIFPPASSARGRGFLAPAIPNPPRQPPPTRRPDSSASPTTSPPHADSPTPPSAPGSPYSSGPGAEPPPPTPRSRSP